MGVKMTVEGNQTLCQECPPSSTQIPFTQKVLIPNTALPLGDISSTLTLISDTSVACFQVDSVGYQHPTWRSVFVYVPVAITIFAALNSFFQSFSSLPETERDLLLFTSNYANLPTALRLKTPGFFDVIHYCQTIVSLGQLNLDFPSFYPLFVSNLGWSYGLFSNRWLDRPIHSIFPSDLSPPPSNGLSFNKRQEQPAHFLPVAGTGIANVALALGIDINGQFLTCLVYYLLILAGCLVICGLVWAIYRPNTGQPNRMGNFTIGVAIRSLSLFYLPLLITSLYQLMLPSPWYLTFVAALMVVFPLILLYGYIGFDLLSVRPSSLVYSEPSLLLKFGSLYNTFADNKFYFFALTIVYKFIVGAAVAMGQPNPVSQVTILILVETIYYVLHWTQWPYADQAINIHYIMFGSLRLIATWLTIAFLPELNISLDARQWVAYIQIIIHAIVLLIMLILPVKNLFIMVTGMLDETLFDPSLPPPRMVLWRRRLNRADSQEHLGAEKRVADEDKQEMASKMGNLEGQVIGVGVGVGRGVGVGGDRRSDALKGDCRDGQKGSKDCHGNFGCHGELVPHQDLDWVIPLPSTGP
ncbi:hypothetical protein CLU79DRAFT_721231 [Phycomyces nitens]|nr:hypothetical protein CLU79DRAFT_721231 [Phycomyces nitens]